MGQQLFVIGLGNPGKEYALTRHNFGFMVVDKFISLLSSKTKLKIRKEKLYIIAETKYIDEKDATMLSLIEPLTYMNNSGDAVIVLKEKYNTKIDSILVIYDDFTLPLGRLRLRRKGRSGGHLGLESIITSLGTVNFPRLRLGIGPLPIGMNPTEFVLGKFTKDELSIVDKVIDTSIDLIKYYLMHSIEETASKYNSMTIKLAGD